MLNVNLIEYEKSFGRMSQLPPSDGPELAFIGRSNVGKSSMINKVFNRKSLARTSRVPGKTATINFYKLDAARFVDLPGYGYAKLSKTEQARLDELIRGYLRADRHLELVFLLVDMRHSPSPLDIKMADFLIDNELPFVVALTKADKLSPKQQAIQLEIMANELPGGEDITFIPFSSQTGLGVEDIHAIIEDILYDEDPEI